jgi:predicted ATP-binding protein involved in virulence
LTDESHPNQKIQHTARSSPPLILVVRQKETRMKMLSVKIQKLFGYADIDIPLKQSDDITLIHGPNGCGKTTILELIRSVLKSDYARLKRIPFHSCAMKYDDGASLSIVKVEGPVTEESGRPPTRPIQFKYCSTDSSGKESTFEQKWSTPRERTFPMAWIEREIPELIRTGSSEWLNRLTGETMSLDEVLEQYSDQLRTQRQVKQVPDWLEMRLSSADIHLIRSQRLLLSPHQRRYPDQDVRRAPIRETVDYYARELGRTISEKLAESVNIAQSLDRTFPSRLLQTSTTGDVTEEALRQLYAAIEEKRQRLMGVGLIDDEGRVALPTQAMEETERKVLALYLDDTEKKLNAFADIERKLTTFCDILNGKMSKTKTVTIDRRKGFVFSPVHAPEQKLQPTQLSSGEQHQVVLFYELLFQASPGSIILIDEPEISLHVDWQRQFLKDLGKVNSLSQHTFIIATHSPQIIHDRWDLAVPIQGGLVHE